MNDLKTAQKWDATARFFDLMAVHGAEKRWAPAKRALFAHMGTGHILFLAAGTGLDFVHFPPGRHITTIDISTKMLERARPRAETYEGHIELFQMDARCLTYPTAHFDQVFTSCTFCSVPDPVDGLIELRRVLKPNGELILFEHTGSQILPFRWMLNLMNPLMRPFGPEINRPTEANLLHAGFEIISVIPYYLDVVKGIIARAPSHSPA
jgi:ubiquinone/menaquinone biosynthesis C-methylase UbiE